ncbi:MAG: hypothetical protein Q7T38_07555 [Gallionella sp.]|nr:hypothetical protein [Gallionella sp.]
MTISFVRRKLNSSDNILFAAQCSVLQRTEQQRGRIRQLRHDKKLADACFVHYRTDKESGKEDDQFPGAAHQESDGSRRVAVPEPDCLKLLTAILNRTHVQEK